ncbi:MAG: hypothetical protein WCI28_12440, partial [Opitutaceae bacterium]
MKLNPQIKVSLLRSVLRTFLLGAITATFAQAQVAPATATEGKNKDKEIIELPAFEVVSSKDKGYFARQSVSGMKTSQALVDIAANISVIPRDLIDDIGT